MPEKVLGYRKSVFSSNIIISKTHEIIQKNSVAISPDGLVGVVVACNKKFAEVLPITSSKIAVPLKAQSGIHLIISGTDQDIMILSEIQGSRITELFLGDILYSSGEGGLIPKDIPVAKVTKVDMKRSDYVSTSKNK